MIPAEAALAACGSVATSASSRQLGRHADACLMQVSACLFVQARILWRLQMLEHPVLDCNEVDS